MLVSYIVHSTLRSIFFNEQPTDFEKRRWEQLSLGNCCSRMFITLKLVCVVVTPVGQSHLSSFFVPVLDDGVFFFFYFFL